jgi:D-arabinose 1-dehydrogenase-like Zn-dependent alcohol dehydrogenase
MSYQSGGSPQVHRQPVDERRRCIATAPRGAGNPGSKDGRRPNDKLKVLGVRTDPMEVTPKQVIRGNQSIRGWTAVTPTDREDALRFAKLGGMGPMTET